MTDIGEKIAVTTITPEEDPKYHFAELQICYPNGTPYFADENFDVFMSIDGDERAAQTNFESSVNQCLLEPGSQVEFDIEPSIDDHIAETRQKIKEALDVILDKEREEKKILDSTLDQEGWLSRKLILTGAFMAGVGDGVVGIFEFVGDTAELVYDAAWYKNQVLIANNLEAAWETYFRNGDVDDFFNSVGEKNVEDFAEAFGVTPQQLKQQIADAYHIFNFIMDDPETRDILLQFALDYAQAQAKVEIARMSGSAAFEIILAAILAVTTGGAGNAAQAGAKVKHFQYFKKLAEHLRKLVGQLKKKAAKVKLKGKLDKKIQHKVEVPKAQKIDVEQPKKPKDSSSNKNSNSNADSAQSQTGQNQSQTQNTSQDSGGSKTQNTDEPGKNKQGEVCSPDNKACTGAEPINLLTGEEMLTLEDFTLPGPLTLSWSRTYKSSNPDNCGLGYGWTHSFSEHLEIKSNRVDFHTNEARIVSFPLPAVGSSSVNRFEKLSIHRTRDNCFEIASTDAELKITKHFERLETTSQLAPTRIEDSYGNHFILTYQGNRLDRIEAQYGEFWQLEYNDQNTLASVHRVFEDGSSKTLVEYHYNNHNDLTKAFDANGNYERYAYRNHLIAQRKLKSGYKLHFKWDSTDHHARCLEQYGDKINGQATYHYRFKWDKNNRRVAMTDTRGGTECYQFNQQGLPIYHRSPEGSETHTQYDNLGNITAIKTPNGHFQKYTYDEQQRLIIFTDPLGHKHEFKRNDAGAVTDIYDPMGNRWQRTLNSKGAVCKQINPLGETLNFSYNTLGLINSVTNAEGNSWHYIWDNKGKITAIKDPLGRHTRYSYNAEGKLAKITYPDFLTSEFEFDDAGSCLFIKERDGKTSRFEYNELGLITKITDHNNRITQYSYDGLSQIVRKVDSKGHILRYQYDGERNLVGLTNQNGEQYKLVYDLDERLIQEVGFDGRIQEYHYDAEGNLIGKADISRDRKTSLNEIVFKRDVNGQLLEQAQLNPNGIHRLNRFEYDALGRLVKAENKQRQLKWAFDAAGRITEDHQDQYVIKHRYNKSGVKTQSILPSGDTVDYTYNLLNQFSGLNFNGQSVTQVQHDVFGREIARQHGNQLSTEYRYDPQGRLIAQRTGKQSAKGQFKAVSHRRLNYNNQGLLQQIEDKLRGKIQYHYDALDRLVQVDGPNPEQIIHDPAGNILSTQGDTKITGSMSEKGNRLNHFSDQHFTYDDLGNRFSTRRGKGQSQITQFCYDALNQLQSVETEDLKTTYAYDPLGRRISKQTDQKRVEFLWMGDILLSETTQVAEASHSKTYLFQPGTFEPIAFVQDKQIYHYHLDHLGTPQEITNSKGKLVWAASYRAYGNLAIAHKDEVENNLRFQGQYFDEETGLHYNRFRYYDPNCGRFINQDPIGLLGGLNNYLYVPNPTGWVDPFGLTAKPGDCPKNKKTTYWGDSRRDAFREAKKDARIPLSQHPDKISRVPLDDGYGNKILNKDGNIIEVRQYHYKNIDGNEIVIQEHSLGHTKATAGHGKEPHFNVRKVDENTGEVLNTSSVSGTHGHYNF